MLSYKKIYHRIFTQNSSNVDIFFPGTKINPKKFPGWEKNKSKSNYSVFP